MAPWLIILDNADISDVLFRSIKTSPIASYLPKSSNGKVLITSRNLNIAERLVGRHKAIISLPEINSDEAFQLYKKSSSIDTMKPQSPNSLSTWILFPLTISQAAAYINRRHLLGIAVDECFAVFDRAGRL